MLKASWVLISMSAVLLAACSSAMIDKDAVEGALIDHSADFSSCYEQGTKSMSPRPAGVVRINFVINQAGDAHKVVVESTTLHVPLAESCIVGVIEKIHFPSSQGEDARISYPFRFAPH